MEEINVNIENYIINLLIYVEFKIEKSFIWYIKNYNMTIIGLCGNKRAGKDTFADHLITKYKGIQKYSFAGPLKKACRIMFCLNDEQINGPLKETLDERWGLSPRQMFQTFGTDLVRNQYSKLVPGTKLEEVGAAFWVYRFQIWYKQWKKNNPDKILIITDIRFPDELKVVKGMGGIIIKITRPSFILKDSHISEKNINNMSGDYDLINCNSLEEYKKKIEKIYLRVTKSSDNYE